MAKKYSHLTYEQRCQVQTLKDRGDSPSNIAKTLGFHPSAIYREIARNSGKRGYRYKQAQQKAEDRRSSKPSPNKKMTPTMMQIIEEKIKLDWSPRQLSGWLKKHGHPAVSYETIYQYIWTDKKRMGTLYKHLRHRGKKYNKRGKGKAGRGCIPNRIDIKERALIVEEKNRIGDWEGDTVIGCKGHSVLVTLVDKASKLTRLKKSPDKTAKQVSHAVIEKLHSLKEFSITGTFDNGKEFSDHQTISKALQISIFFATPYHSWERGLNEHTNGLIRQYFPKGTNFDNVSNEEIERVELLLNTRPRECLNFETPLEAWERFATSQYVIR